jgi:hypothetical protein
MNIDRRNYIERVKSINQTYSRQHDNAVGFLDLDDGIDGRMIKIVIATSKKKTLIDI